MRALVISKPGQTEICELPIPAPDPYEALVRIDFCVICNSTDQMIIDGTIPFDFIKYPCVLGHESVGRVVSIGDKVTSFKIGDRVTRAGFKSKADDALYSAWGGFAEYGIAEDLEAKKKDGLKHGFAKSMIISESLSNVEASMLISLSEHASFIQQIDLEGKTVLVLGTGIAGLGFTWFAKYYGADKVITAGRRESRLSLALIAGADEVINTKLVEEIPNIKVDVIIEATGNEDALMHTLPMLKNNGEIAVYGLAEEAYKFPLAKSPKQFSICKYDVNEASVMEEVGQLLAEHRIPVEHFVTHEWSIQEFSQAMEQVRSGEVVKGMVWLHDKKEE